MMPFPASMLMGAAPPQGPAIFHKDTGAPAADVTETGTTSTAWRTVRTLTLLASEQVANAYYVVFWAIDCGTNNGANPAFSRVNVNNSANVWGALNAPAHYGNVTSGSINRQAHGGFIVVQAAATPADIEIDVEVKINSTSSSNLFYGNARIAAFELGTSGTDFVYAASLPNNVLSNTTTNKTQATICSLNITTPGNWVVLSYSMGQQANTSTNVHLGLELTDGTNTTGERTIYCTGRGPFNLMLDLPGVTTTRTVSLKFRNATATNSVIEWSDARLLALNLDRFAEVHKRWLAADNDGTEATDTVVETQTFTAANDDYLCVGGMICGAGASAGGVFKVNENATVANMVSKPFLAGGAGLEKGESYFGLRPFTGTGASRTQTLTRASNSVSSRVQKSAFLLTLRLRKSV